MNKFFSFIAIILLACVQAVSGQAKYVFYFIGDGMGISHVNATETYLSALNGKPGTASLLMTRLPVATFVSTFSSDNDVTDSAAAGTALSTGKKTNNGVVGLDSDFNRLETIAEKAKKAGKKVGIASTVPINHATPAAFYAHQKKRGMYYEISQDLLKSGFDFFAGGSFYNRQQFYDGTKAPDIYPLIEKAGYTIAKGYDDFRSNARKAKKVMLLHQNWQTEAAIPYAIDATEKDLTLKQITQAAIDVLTRDNDKGFFLMLESGRIDWASHGNDAAASIKEVMDMDEAVKVAYDFYKKYPEETLIVITADHETGGLVVGKGQLEISPLQHQKQSQEVLSQLINDLHVSKNEQISWEEMKAFLSEKMGFWTHIPINWENEKMLRDAYEKTFVEKSGTQERNLYAENSLLAVTARKVMNNVTSLGWSTLSHSAGYVPLFAVGAGQKQFTHKMDNTDIPKYIMKVAGY